MVWQVWYIALKLVVNLTIPISHKDSPFQSRSFPYLVEERDSTALTACPPSSFPSKTSVLGTQLDRQSEAPKLDRDMGIVMSFVERVSFVVVRRRTVRRSQEGHSQQLDIQHWQLPAMSLRSNHL